MRALVFVSLTLFVVGITSVSSMRPVDPPCGVVTQIDRSKDAGPVITEMFCDLSEHSDSARLWAEIRDHKVAIAWDSTGVAAFNHEGGCETLLLNVDYIRKANVDALAKRRLETFLVHEAVHHRQYHEGRSDVGSCDELWSLELEAYVEQCGFASASAPDSLRFCHTASQKEFREQLLGEFLSRPAYVRQCRKLGGTLAAAL